MEFVTAEKFSCLSEIFFEIRAMFNLLGITALETTAFYKTKPIHDI